MTNSDQQLKLVFYQYSGSFSYACNAGCFIPFHPCLLIHSALKLTLEKPEALSSRSVGNGWWVEAYRTMKKTFRQERLVMSP
ncbi:MAG: hypothetical protein ICV79_24965 [Flavisolibacter sp.]|nr:hypothetical protein [Flavisolibacter sp.]